MSVYSTMDLTREQAEAMLKKEVVDLLTRVSSMDNTELEDLLFALNGDRTLNNYLILHTPEAARL